MSKKKQMISISLQIYSNTQSFIDRKGLQHSILTPGFIMAVMTLSQYCFNSSCGLKTRAQNKYSTHLKYTILEYYRVVCSVFPSYKRAFSLQEPIYFDKCLYGNVSRRYRGMLKGFFTRDATETSINYNPRFCFFTIEPNVRAKL